jgi:hypothetical protein
MADLKIILLPANEGHAVPAMQGPGVARGSRFARTREWRFKARFAPSWYSPEVLWAVTVISTLAITVPSRVSYRAIALILVIELTGFAVGAIWARRRHRRPRDHR